MKCPSIIGVVLSSIAIVIGLSVVWSPGPLPSDAPATEFSAERAFQHVTAIAQRPHQATSKENQRVRAYLLSEISRLGLKVREVPGEQRSTALVNLYAELPGTDGGPPVILLVSHYDSVPTGPGAADCASGAATLLETLRALRASQPLKNSLALLLTDGEELGMAGAQAILRDHPELWRDVRVVLNLEARGNHGPVVMFETSPGAARLISFFAEHCPSPFACSFSREVYRRLPNDTDFTEFLKANCVGMNFAFIGGLEYYHSPRDTPENLSRRTLQQYGDCILPLTAALGQMSASELAGMKDAGEATYFPLWRGCLVRYPQWLAAAFAIVTPALFLFALWRQRRFVRLGRVFGSLVVVFLELVLSVGLGLLALRLLRRTYHPPGRGVFLVGLPFEEGYLALLIFATAALTLGLNACLLHRLRSEERLTGALIPWLGLTLTAAWYVPGAAYLFLWPTLLGTLALFLPSEKSGPPRPFLRNVLTAMPAPLLLAGTLYLMNQAMTIGIVPVSIGLTTLAFTLASCS